MNIDFNQRDIDLIEQALDRELDSIQEWVDEYGERDDLAHIKRDMLGNRVVIGKILSKMKQLAKVS